MYASNHARASDQKLSPNSIGTIHAVGNAEEVPNMP